MQRLLPGHRIPVPLVDGSGWLIMHALISRWRVSGLAWAVVCIGLWAVSAWTLLTGGANNLRAVLVSALIGTVAPALVLLTALGEPVRAVRQTLAESAWLRSLSYVVVVSVIMGPLQVVVGNVLGESPQERSAQAALWIFLMLIAPTALMVRWGRWAMPSPPVRRWRVAAIIATGLLTALVIGRLVGGHPVFAWSPLLWFELIVLLLGVAGEELIFRIWLMTAMERRLGSLAAISISSLAFVAMHIGPRLVDSDFTAWFTVASQVVIVLPAGVFLGLLWLRTRSVTAIIVTHFLIDLPLVLREISYLT